MSNYLLSGEFKPFYLKTFDDSQAPTVPDNLNVLAQIQFSQKAQRFNSEYPFFCVGLPNLEAKLYTEFWLTTDNVQYNHFKSIHYSQTSQVVFGHLLLEEVDFPDFQSATEIAYEHIFELLNEIKFPYLVRMWNYFPAITAWQQNNLNRYHAFCLGRQAALDRFGNFEGAPPAATAIGTSLAGLQIYFIAAQEVGVQLENPRQTSAFLYPRQYGPVSPAFSRATIKTWDGAQHVYISGTTSIVGHQTLHVGDPIAQVKETLQNLEALLQHGGETLGIACTQVRELRQLKVYIHDVQSFEAIRAYLSEYLAGVELPVLYLHGDVCRSDLMVEVEGIYA